MNPLLRLAGWFADTVLKTWFPLEKEPRLEDLARDEAHEEAVRREFAAAWPESVDPVDHLVALVEDIRNLLKSSVVSEAAAETPGEEPSTPPRVQNLYAEADELARQIYALGREEGLHDHTEDFDDHGSAAPLFRVARRLIAAGYRK